MIHTAIRTAAAPLAVVLLASVSGSLAAQGRGVQGEFPQPPPARQVTVTAIPGVIAAGAQWTQAFTSRDTVDGMVATPDGGVLFAQEQPKIISKLDVNDRYSVFLDGTASAGSLALDGRGRVFVVQRTCTDPGLRLATPCTEPTNVSIIYPANERKLLADNFQGKSLGRVNDLVVNKSGTAVFFTSGGAFYVSAEGGEVRSIGQDLRTNGIMLSPDDKTLYVTNGQTIVAFDVGANGVVSHQRDFAKLEAGGNGDGMTVDSTGRLYVSTPPGVQVIAPDGKYLGLIPTPRGVLALAFAGPDKKTLYIDCSGAQYSVDGKEMVTPPGLRNNAKTIYRIPMIAEGFKGRAK